MRLRIRFDKHGKVRFTSHRDVARIWERALRRAGIAVAYTEGFSPRPRLSFGLALPTGYESRGEYLDVELQAPIELDGVVERLSDTLPEGMAVQALAPIPPGTPSLQEDVVACTWLLHVDGPCGDQLRRLVEDVLDSRSIVVARERKGERVVDDVRPGIERLEVVGPSSIEADLATKPRGIRPVELVAACFPEADSPADVLAAAVRLHQWIERDGERSEVLPAAVPSPLHAQGACA